MKSEKTLKYYIPKLLKNISDYYYITMDAKTRMHLILIVIAEKVVTDSIKLLRTTNKNILNVGSLVNSLRLNVSGNLLQNILKEGDTHINMDTPKDARDSLTFSIPFFRHFVERLLPNNVKLSAKYSLFLTAAIEYIAIEILDLSTCQACKGKHVRITGRDIYMAIYNDKELTLLSNRCNITILGVGVMPCNDEWDKESKKLQNDEQLLFPKASFGRMVRELCNAIETDPVKISKETFTVLQYYIENYIIMLLRKTGGMCEYTGKAKITEDDLEFVFNL